MTLVPCRHCSSHVSVEAGTCPGCGGSTTPHRGPTAAALLLGLTAIGWSCGVLDPTPEPPYGVGLTPIETEETGETAETGDTGSR